MICTGSILKNQAIAGQRLLLAWFNNIIKCEAWLATKVICYLLNWNVNILLYIDTLQLNLNFIHVCHYSVCLHVYHMWNFNKNRCAHGLLHFILACTRLPVNTLNTQVMHIMGSHLVGHTTPVLYRCIIDTYRQRNASVLQLDNF